MCNFPQKLRFSQKLHLPLDSWPMCHQPWPSLAFPSSTSHPAFPAGAWDVSPHQSSSACWTQSVELLVLCALPPPSPPRLLMSLETICGAWAAPLCPGDRHPSCHRCQLRLPAWLAQLVGPGKSSSRARICLKMLGTCLNTTFHQTLGVSLGLWEAAFTAPLDPHSAASVLFPTSAVQRKTSWSSWALDLLPVLLWGLGLITEPLISAHTSPRCAMAAILGVYHHPFCSPENQHITDPSSGEQCGMLQIAGFSLCFLCLRLWYLTPVKSVPAFPSLSVEPRFHPIGRNEFFLCARWI